jgi:hypothetical protein
MKYTKLNYILYMKLIKKWVQKQTNIIFSIHTFEHTNVEVELVCKGSEPVVVITFIKSKYSDRVLIGIVKQIRPSWILYQWMEHLIVNQKLLLNP